MAGARQVLSPEARLGHYQIVEAIGRGGVAVVYRARDLQLGREVALKVVTTACLATPVEREMFLNEARITAAVSSPYVVSVYGLGVGHGIAYVALELLDGETLRSRLDREARGFDVATAVEIALDLARGLAAVHHAGVAHGDLTPSNVMLSTGGVRILDFGLAHAKEVERCWTENASSTQVFRGSPWFMAPERWSSREVSKEADVWAFGTILYHLIEGRSPWVGDTLAEVFAAVCLGPNISLESRLHDAHPLYDIILACLQRNPSSRPTAPELERRLAALKSHGLTASEARHTPPDQCHVARKDSDTRRESLALDFLRLAERAANTWVTNGKRRQDLWNGTAVRRARAAVTSHGPTSSAASLFLAACEANERRKSRRAVAVCAAAALGLVAVAALRWALGS
jgi:serine/threonine protein kinase